LKWEATLALLVLALPAGAQMRLVSTAPVAAAPAAPPAYEDRVIEGLAPLVEEASGKPYDATGWPRFLRLETRLSTLDASGFDEGDRRNVGGIAAGSIETPHHGVVSFDASIAPDEGSSVLTVRQRALPVEGGWLVNNEAGVISPAAPAMMRLPARVFVPAVLTRGAGTEWLHAGEQLQFQASTGELGRLQGYPVPGFLDLLGSVTTFGAQGRIGEWGVAARHARAEGVSYFDTAASRARPIDANSTHLAVRRETESHVLSANVIGSRSTETQGARYGVWMEGEARAGRSTRAFGLYRLDTELSWAGQAMASDVQGAYVRGTWHARQWDAQGSIDALQSLSGERDTGVLVTGSGQYRYSRSLSFGAGGAARRYNGDAANVYADARWRTGWGTSGLRVETSRYDRERAHRLSVDHDWELALGWNLSTSVTAGRESGSERAGTLWGASASISAPIAQNAMLTGNGSFERRGNGDRTGSANVSLTWQMARDWALEGNYVYSSGRQELIAPIDPLAPLPERFTLASDTRSLYLVLRYELRGGTRTQPLGGPLQGGGGAVEGIVFLDANRNGHQEASERGAAGVTVYLDGRYATRTDAQGRFVFPFVATGARVVTVLNETLPLPWDVGRNAQTPIEVRVRESTRVAIPVERRAD
jgi:hypothetical protein